MQMPGPSGPWRDYCAAGCELDGAFVGGVEVGGISAVSSGEVGTGATFGWFIWIGAVRW